MAGMVHTGQLGPKGLSGVGRATNLPCLLSWLHWCHLKPELGCTVGTAV